MARENTEPSQACLNRRGSEWAEVLRLQEQEERDTISQGGANVAPVSVTVAAEKAAEQLVLEEGQRQERKKCLNVKKQQDRLREEEVRRKGEEKEN